MEDEELNSILRVLENPIRRRIIKRLSHGPSYPLRLSKELGLGQPLVARHLVVMEEAGLVSSSMEEGSGGPERRSYSLAKSISITLDMAPNLFGQRGFSFDTVKGRGLSDRVGSMLNAVSKISRNDGRAIASLSTMLERIDRRIDEIEEERVALLYVRNMAMKTVSEAMESVEGEEKRRLIYSVLEEHTRDVEDLSESLDLRESVVRDILKEIGSLIN